MSRHAGVLRSPDGLRALAAHLADVADVALAGPGAALDVAAVEATNLHTVSTVLTAAAAARTESRGCHRRTDVDAPRPEWRTHLAVRLDRSAADGALAPLHVAPERAEAAA